MKIIVLVRWGTETVPELQEVIRETKTLVITKSGRFSKATGRLVGEGETYSPTRYEEYTPERWAELKHLRDMFFKKRRMADLKKRLIEKIEQCQNEDLLCEIFNNSFCIEER